MSRDLDQTGYDFIEHFEVCILHPYDDHGHPIGARIRYANGVWRRDVDGAICIGYPTIGIGRRIWPAKAATTPDDIDRATAVRWYREDMAPFVGDVDRLLPGLNDHQRAAATSLCFNAGKGGLISSGLPKAVEEGRWDDCKACFMSIVRSRINGALVVNAGLVLRRTKEAAMWATPMPSEAEPLDSAAILASVELTARAMLADDPSLMR